MSGAHKRTRSTDPSKPRNLTVDAETQQLLAVAVDKLEAELGFRPTLSQAIRMLVHKAARS